ncbi:MAG: hypothetical protein ABF976_00035 [Acetobacter syzygii]|uniref:hypothetical protein n=1 Tax=Acetobacter syzygii TaxID=146476 RepID=UPI0024305669|nr:hypothetical protein [Acetobacter syzygii]
MGTDNPRDKQIPPKKQLNLHGLYKMRTHASCLKGCMDQNKEQMQKDDETHAHACPPQNYPQGFPAIRPLPLWISFVALAAKYYKKCLFPAACSFFKLL